MTFARSSRVRVANDLGAPAPPLPPSRFVSARRVGPGRLVAYSAREADRERVLKVLRTTP